MKKFLIIFLLLSLISCTSLKSHEIDTPASTATIGLSATTTTIAEVIATQNPTSAATIEPSITLTSFQEVTETPPVLSVVQKDFVPLEWKVLFDKNWVSQIELGLNEQIWIATGEQVGYFNGEDWVLYSEKDYNLPDGFWDMAMASDGTVWLSGQNAIAHYQDGLWNVFPIPDAPEVSNPRLAIDSSNLIWLSLWGCHCRNPIRTFDGVNWDNQPISSFGEASQLIFTSDEILWASFAGALGQCNKNTWILFPLKALWPNINDSIYLIQIASDSQGNIFGIYRDQAWIVKINRDGNISKIPFDFKHYVFSSPPELFIDKQDKVWTNACYNDIERGCLIYYQDNQWISFRNLPFRKMIDMKELSDGTFLVATYQGLFQYKPEN